MPTDPMTPNGSRTKILISSQVSLHSPRSIMPTLSVANRVARQREKHVLERRELCAEVGYTYPMLRQTLDHVRHQIVLPAANGELQPLAGHRLDLWDRQETLRGCRILGHERHAPLGAVARDEFGRR